MIPGSANPLLLASAAQAGGYAIERSLRFNSADSAYLSRTPASAGNRKTWTWAGWVKRSNVLARGIFYGNVDSSANNGAWWLFESDDKLYIEDFGPTYVRYISSGVFRDMSAWMHLCVACDTTQVAEADRLKVYINGVIHPGENSLPPPLDYEMKINTTQTLGLGRAGLYAPKTFPGYLADIHFIDGYAYDPSYFTEFDDNGILQPKAFTGSYGTNGFHLTFSDNSTAGSLGDDSSGNGNNWTVNNISVAAGAGNDSMVDVPTNGTETDTGLGAEVRGNYATFNPLASAGSFSNGNLRLDVTSGNESSGISTISLPQSGKWYWEVTMDSIGSDPYTGITSGTSTTGIGSAAVAYRGDGRFYSLPAATLPSNGASYTTGDVIGMAFNADILSLAFYKNGASQGTVTNITAGQYFTLCYCYNVSARTINFGQRPFAYTAPSGFKALCTANLPSTTITTSGSYTGNGVADGPFVFLNGVPTAMTVDGNAVTFGTDADKLSNGFKIRTTSTTFNQNASTYNYSITSTGDPFKTARAQAN